jgi:hypothetical protein
VKHEAWAHPVRIEKPPCLSPVVPDNVSLGDYRRKSALATIGPHDGWMPARAKGAIVPSS